MQADIPVRVSLKLVRALAEEHEQALVGLALKRSLITDLQAAEAAGGAMLVERGWIRPDQLEALRESVRALEYIPMAMGGASEMPDAAREAMQDPRNEPSPCEKYFVLKP